MEKSELLNIEKSCLCPGEDPLTEIWQQPAVPGLFLPGILWLVTLCNLCASTWSPRISDTQSAPWGLEIVTLWVVLVCIWTDILALSEEINAQPQEANFCSMSRCCKTHQFLAVKVQFALPLPLFFFLHNILCKHLDVCLNLPDFRISTFAQKYITKLVKTKMEKQTEWGWKLKRSKGKACGWLQGSHAHVRHEGIGRNKAWDW